VTDTPRNVMQVLRKIGFSKARITASHHIFKRGTTLIPVPDHPGDLNTKTFHRILRNAGLTIDDYISLR
jgi:predicted RNA binding protein YcfA (HicA-like mRNA interferase family)